MKKHLLAALILLPLTLSAAPASAAGEAADQARLINLFDMAELSGILHKEAMECGISRQDDPFYAPGGKLHTVLLKGIKQTAAKLKLDMNDNDIQIITARAYAQGKGKKERLFAESADWQRSLLEFAALEGIPLPSVQNAQLARRSFFQRQNETLGLVECFLPALAGYL